MVYMRVIVCIKVFALTAYLCMFQLLNYRHRCRSMANNTNNKNQNRIHGKATFTWRVGGSIHILTVGRDKTKNIKVNDKPNPTAVRKLHCHRFGPTQMNC